MKISAITAQVKTRGRYSIFVDGEYSFSLSEAALIESGLRVGATLEARDLAAFKELSKTDKLYNRTLALLARRPRSQKEMVDYLSQKTDDEQIQEKTLNKLINFGFIDDQAFATAWVESRRLLKSTSRRKLRLELLQKGISDEIITSVLAADQTDELTMLRELIAKKRRQSRYQDQTKLMQYLVRQGFSYSDVKEALKES